MTNHATTGAAKLRALEPEVLQRIKFYTELLINDPDSKACPAENLRGLLVNVAEFNEYELFVFPAHWKNLLGQQ